MTNNDRFKYRAWDKVSKTMREVTHLDLGSYPKGTMLEGVWGEIGKGNFYLMQCTGLKDKNGKLIYDGDIVDIAGYGKYTCEFPFIELYDLDDPSDIGGIIGNIYENSNLLEVKNAK